MFKCIFRLFRVVLGLSACEVGATLSVNQSNVEITEIRQVQRAITIPSRTGCKVSLRNDIMYGIYFLAVLV